MDKVIGSGLRVWGIGQSLMNFISFFELSLLSSMQIFLLSCVRHMVGILILGCLKGRWYVGHRVDKYLALVAKSFIF